MFASCFLGRCTCRAGWLVWGSDKSCLNLTYAVFFIFLIEDETERGGAKGGGEGQRGEGRGTDRQTDRQRKRQRLILSIERPLSDKVVSWTDEIDQNQVKVWFTVHNTRHLMFRED